MNAGLTVGIVLGVILLGLIVFWLLRRRKRNKAMQEVAARPISEFWPVTADAAQAMYASGGYASQSDGKYELPVTTQASLHECPANCRPWEKGEGRWRREAGEGVSMKCGSTVTVTICTRRSEHGVALIPWKH